MPRKPDEIGSSHDLTACQPRDCDIVWLEFVEVPAEGTGRIGPTLLCNRGKLMYDNYPTIQSWRWSHGSRSGDLWERWVTLYLGGPGGLRQPERPCSLYRCQEGQESLGGDAEALGWDTRGPGHRRGWPSHHRLRRNVRRVRARVLAMAFRPSTLRCDGLSFHRLERCRIRVSNCHGR